MVLGTRRVQALVYLPLVCSIEFPKREKTLSKPEDLELNCRERR